MNEHTIRGIAEIAYMANRAARRQFLGHDHLPEFDELPDDDMDSAVELTRDILSKLSENPGYIHSNPQEKVFAATVKALAANPNLV